MNLSNSFTLEELTFSYEGERKGLDNTPDAETVIHLTELAQYLERAQRILQSPLHINSAFRSPKVNSAVGGSGTSAHLLGYAADFTCKGFGSPIEVCRKLAAEMDYDQIILEYDRWCHLSIDPRMRKQVLTKRSGTPYQDGLIQVS